MIKCEVIVDRASLVVGKGSIVVVDDRQYEVARQFLKPVETKSKVEEVEEVKVEKVGVVKEEPKKENKQQKKK